MAPVHLKLFSGKRFKADKSSSVFILLPDAFNIIAENGSSAGVSNLDKTLPDDLCADVRLSLKEKIYLVFIPTTIIDDLRPLATFFFCAKYRLCGFAVESL